MNVYELITREGVPAGPGIQMTTAFRYTKVAATSAAKAWVIFKTKFPGLAKFTDDDAELVETKVDRELAEHYGCVNVADVNWTR